MKKINLLIPITCASLASIVTPLTVSCGNKYQYEWNLGDNFKYGYEGIELPSTDFEELNDKYFEIIKDDPNIFIKDWMVFQLIDKESWFPDYASSIGCDRGVFYHTIKLQNINAEEHRLSFEGKWLAAHNGLFELGCRVKNARFDLDGTIDSNESTVPIMQICQDVEWLAQDKEWVVEIWMKDEWDNGVVWHMDWEYFDKADYPGPPSTNFTTFCPFYFLKGTEIYEAI